MLVIYIYWISFGDDKNKEDSFFFWRSYSLVGKKDIEIIDYNLRYEILYYKYLISIWV